MITQEYNINLIPRDVPVVVNASQYDKTSRTIKFHIYNGTSLFSIPTDATISVRGTKPDKTGFAYNCSFGSTSAWFSIQQQMTVLSGKVPCELRIARGSKLIGTANFILDVEKSALADDTIISETDIPLLEEAVEAADRAEAAASQASSVLASAVKKVNNVSPDSSGNVNVLAVPAGGLTNQVLAKASATSGNTAWKYMSFRLWENTAETSDFQSKEIPLSNINDYGCIIVVYRMAKHSGYENYTSVVIPNHIGVVYRTSMFIGTGNETYRTATRRTTGVFFGVANLNDTSDNAYMIPVAIYGVA